ncbi:MAG TPA: NAD(P)/FAD-dependent oxidoreductase, partial [Gammaproteobacteria bacterium]|nr:NAD(P)/FAD-dependent oxidoreductase [Gammaproteobacteria bacterium]
RGLAPVVIERATEEAALGAQGGRSINLALAARGIAGLERAGVREEIEPLLLPMRGRQVHEGGAERFLPYGQRRGEEIYSVSRADLNGKLQALARERFGVEYRYGHVCTGLDLDAASALIEGPQGRYRLDAEMSFAADGAGSGVRRSLAEAGLVQAHEALLDHGYIELAIPEATGGGFALRPDALHIWPRGGFMLIALPNRDRTFTATLFLPLTGEKSFASLSDGRLRELFEAEFPDALRLIPDAAGQFASRPVGKLGTIHCRPWSFRNRLLLLGDAAHAIVPFHGQGMNAAFEDCATLDGLLAAYGPDWPALVEEFERARMANAKAIAEMAIENYLEMRDSVRSPDFELKRKIAFELERRFPERFVPRYQMVMFHAEIPYAEAQRRGAVQAEILAELAGGAKTLDEVDFARAERLVEERL